LELGGSGLPLTCDRDDPRKSIVDGTDVLADVAGLRLVNGVFVVDPLKGDTNRCTTVLEDWDIASVTISADGDVLTAVNAASGDKYADSYTAGIGTTWTATFDLELISGDPTDWRSGLGEAGGLPVTTEDLSAMSIGDVKRVSVTGTTSTTQVRIIAIEYNDSGTSSLVVKISNPRLVESTAPAAGFPDLSPAGTDYLKDILTFLHTFTATATMQFTVTPYGWGADGNPVAAECVLFESGAFRLKLSAAGFIEIDETCISTKKLTANTLSVITVKYDGVNHTLQVDGETPVVAASAIIPGGTSYVGDTAAGDKTAHAVEHIAIYDDKLFTPAEITVGEQGYQARLGDLVLR